MKIENVAVGSLSQDPANVRTHGSRNLDAIKASLRRFGQQKPIIVDASNVVRAGNGTLESAMALGWETIDIIKTGLVASEATAFAIADNRTAELGEWDESGLADLLISLSDSDDQSILESTGFSEDEVEALIEKLEPPQSPEDFESYDENIQTDFECPRCNYKWSGKHVSDTPDSK